MTLGYILFWTPIIVTYLVIKDRRSDRDAVIAAVLMFVIMWQVV